MSKQDFTPSGMEDYRCWVDFPDGWIGLTLESDSEAEADALAEELVDEFNPLNLRVTKAALKKEIKRLALAASEEQVALAAACYTVAGGYIAHFEVDIYGDESKRVTLDDVLPLMTQSRDAKLFREPEVTHVELPLGPAARVQALFKTKKMFGLGQHLVESVQYAIASPMINDVLVARVRWDALERSDELSKAADELASALRIIPCDADGQPLDPDFQK